MSYINGSWIPQKKQRKKNTQTHTYPNTPKRTKKKRMPLKNGDTFPTPQSTRRGRSVYAAFAQRGGSNAGWAAGKKDEVNGGADGDLYICIIISKFFCVWMGKFFLDGELSEHLDFTFWNLCEFFFPENLNFRGEHGGWTGFHVRFRSFSFSTGILRKKNIFNKKYTPENSNWHHAMGPRGRFRKRQRFPARFEKIPRIVRSPQNHGNAAVS